MHPYLSGGRTRRHPPADIAAGHNSRWAFLYIVVAIVAADMSAHGLPAAAYVIPAGAIVLMVVIVRNLGRRERAQRAWDRRHGRPF